MDTGVPVEPPDGEGVEGDDEDPHAATAASRSGHNTKRIFMNERLLHDNCDGATLLQVANALPARIAG